MTDRAILFGLFIVLLIALHFGLHVALGWNAAPDLLTVAALLAARRMTAPWATAFGVVLGLLQDSLTLTGFGASALVLSVLCFLGARSRDLFEGESLLFVALYLFLGKWLRDAGVYLLGQTERLQPVEALAIGAPIAAAFAAVIGAVALALFRSMSGART
jgi:rod shape-determining protein MreD